MDKELSISGGCGFVYAEGSVEKMKQFIDRINDLERIRLCQFFLCSITICNCHTVKSCRTRAKNIVLFAPIFDCANSVTTKKNSANEELFSENTDIIYRQ